MPVNYTFYPKNWKSEIRPRILKRANNRCEFCGLENYSDYPGTEKRVILTIAHLDHDEENHNVTDDRLAALCQRCHLKYDAKDNEKRRLLKRNKTKALHRLQPKIKGNIDFFIPAKKHCNKNVK